MSENHVDGLSFEYEPVGRTGRVRLTCKLPDGAKLTDKFDVMSASGRERFLDRLCRGRDGLDREQLAAYLERLASDVLDELSAADDPDGPDDPSGGSEAEHLVALGKQAELFHTPGGYDSEGFASLDVNGHRETWPITSRAFKRWLSKEHFDRSRSVARQESLSAALNVLAGTAIHNGFEDELAVRLAERDGRIYLDLADDQWRVAEIGPQGWRVIQGQESPVRFIRKRGMLPLPMPERGGCIEDLRRFVNVPGDDGWILYSACLVAYMRPSGPYPVLVFSGEHGSAKTTTARCARAVIDPNQAPLRRPPSGDRDLMIATSNSWIVAFENVSRLSDQMSDALCVISTGGGFSTRELYTDDEEKIFEAQRPVMLNGIEEVATRSDLLDRSVLLALPLMPESERLPEDEFWKEFDRARPRILGGLLDAVACGLRRLPEVNLGHYPRMADFAKWAVACAPAMGWESERFLSVYSSNRRATDWVAVESSLIGPPLVKLLESRGKWEGTASDLVAALSDLADGRTSKNKGWPDKGQKMRWALKRIAPNLRKIGYAVEFGLRSADKSRDRILRVSKVPEGSSELSGSSGNGPGDPKNADPGGRSSIGPNRGSSEDRPPEISPGDPAEADADAPDGADDPSGTFGSAGDDEWGEL